MISSYHIFPSKVRAYNSKGELKILLFMYVLLLVCNLTCRYVLGGGYKGRGSRYKGRGSRYKGRGRGYEGRGSRYKGGRVGIRGIRGGEQVKREGV